MIEIQHLKKQFGKKSPLVDVNATIQKGDVISVIGPSGTGKSTLLRCINLLEKPTAGRILLNGEDITDPKCDINRVRTKLAMVFQSFNLYEHLTVVENCMLAQTVLLKRSRQEAYDKAMELLESVGLTSKALEYPALLSGGQKQRTAIARALSTDPEIILFDEPTSALDPLSVLEVESVIANLSKQGRTMMIVTHGMDFAKRVSNRAFYMDQGIIYEDGTTEQIFDYPQKELTRQFIKRFSSIDMMVYEETHDLNAEVGKIYNFCKEKNIDEKRTMNACGAYEEYCSILYRYAFGDDRSMHVTLEYEEERDKLKFYITPSSVRDWSEIEKKVTASLEYRIFNHYLKGYSEEKIHDENGDRIQYMYEIR